jgi:hypothetical protein
MKDRSGLSREACEEFNLADVDRNSVGYGTLRSSPISDARLFQAPGAISFNRESQIFSYQL